MANNKLFIGVILLAALGVATYFAYKPPASVDADRIQDPWHAIDRAQITKLVIQRAGDAPAVELEKRDNHWFMNRPAQGPADETAVNEAIEALSQMHVASIASRETASHTDLEVDAAHAIHVQLFHGAASSLDVFVGKNLDGGSAVRALTGPNVYRVDRSIRFSLTKEPREWRDRSISHVERAHVRSVDWQVPSGTWHFDRNGDTWTAAATNPPVERLDTARVNQTVTNLLELRAMDFAAAGANTGITAESPRFTVNVDNGSPVILKLGTNANDNEVYVQREGNETIFTMGRTHGNEINVTPTTFQAPPPPNPDAGAPAAPPQAHPTMPGDGGVPPEVMEQIRRQMMQRGMAMPH